MSGHSPRRRFAAVFALSAVLAIGACAADSTESIGTPTGDSASEPSPEPSPTAEPTPSESPASSDSPTPTGETGETGLVNAVDLCKQLDLRTLVRITGMPLEEGTFDGAACTWAAKDELGTLVMSLGEAERTAAYIEEVQDLDIGEVVDVTGADDAAAVTITSGSGAGRNTRVALAAKMGRQRLTVILIGKDANLETAVELAELVVGA